MLTTPDTNIQFSEQDSLRIEKAAQRLAGIMRDIDIHSSAITSLKAECLSKEKEKRYLDEQIVDFSEKLSNLKTDAMFHAKSLESAKTSLSDMESKKWVISEYLSKRESDVKNAEATLEQLQSNHSARVSEFEKESKKLAEHKEVVDKAHGVLKQAVESIKW